MPRKTEYGVQFTGYSARVIAKKYGREVDYALLDFVSDAASMKADGGWVMVQKRTDLEPFLKNLPELANDLEDRLRQGGGELSYGPNTVSIAAGTKINRFIRQVTKRFTEIEQVLEQAEKIGLGIKRRPYTNPQIE